MIFDMNGNGSISRGEMKATVSRIYRERRVLVKSLSDLEKALRKLDIVMLVIFTFLTALGWFYIFKVDTTFLASTVIPVTAGLTFALGGQL